MTTNGSLITPRLLLRAQCMHDFDRMYAMSVDAAVMKYVGDGAAMHWTRKVARHRFRQQCARQIPRGLGTLAVVRRHDRLYLGWCAVTLLPSRLNSVELGYRFCRDVWGRGYATEAAAAMLENAFGAPDIHQVHASVHSDNRASIRVLEKLGFIPARPQPGHAGTRQISWYTLRPANFQHAHRPAGPSPGTLPAYCVWSLSAGHGVRG